MAATEIDAHSSSAPPPYYRADVNLPPPAMHDSTYTQSSMFSPLAGLNDDEDDPRNVQDSSASIYAASTRPPSLAPTTRPSIELGGPSTAAEATRSRHPSGFKSEEAYLNALRAWAEEKKFVHVGDGSEQLHGFYGAKTMEEYGAPAREKRRRKSSLKENGGTGRGDASRGAAVSSVPEDRAVDRDHRDGQRLVDDNDENDPDDIPRPVSTGRRRSSISAFLRRVRTGEGR